MKTQNLKIFTSLFAFFFLEIRDQVGFDDARSCTYNIVLNSL